jgi:hypothetical protein
MFGPLHAVVIFMMTGSGDHYGELIKDWIKFSFMP